MAKKKTEPAELKSSLDNANSAVILITFILFAVALFVKGFTQDLLLEVGVFLVSVKLIIATYQNKMIGKAVLAKLEKLEEKFDKN